VKSSKVLYYPSKEKEKDEWRFETPPPPHNLNKNKRKEPLYLTLREEEAPYSSFSSFTIHSQTKPTSSRAGRNKCM
jgi:hypothetical protein